MIDRELPQGIAINGALLLQWQAYRAQIDAENARVRERWEQASQEMRWRNAEIEQEHEADHARKVAYVEETYQQAMQQYQAVPLYRRWLVEKPTRAKVSWFAPTLWDSRLPIVAPKEATWEGFLDWAGAQERAG